MIDLGRIQEAEVFKNKLQIEFKNYDFDCLFKPFGSQSISEDTYIEMPRQNVDEMKKVLEAAQTGNLKKS